MKYRYMRDKKAQQQKTKKFLNYAFVCVLPSCKTFKVFTIKDYHESIENIYMDMQLFLKTFLYAKLKFSLAIVVLATF